MFAKDNLNNTTALHTVSRSTAINDPSTGCIKTTTSSLLLNKLINAKQLVLNKSSNSFKIVLEVLKIQNTNCIANSTVLSTCAMLINTKLADFARIITSIRINCVKNNFTILAFVLEIEKQRLQEYKQNRLYQIKKDQKQMNMLSIAQLKREEEYQEKIACLSIREFANCDLKDTLSKPTKLIRDFKQKDKFKKLIRDLNREKAYNAKRQG
jgi:hypothetical protein